jgi:arginase family enzyme
VLTLGGDHTVALPMLRALSARLRFYSIVIFGP